MERLVEGIRQFPQFAELVRFFQKELRLLSETQEFEVVAQLLAVARSQLGARATIRADEMCGMECWIERQGGETEMQRDWFIAQVRASLPSSMTLTAHLIGRAVDNPSLVSRNIAYFALM